MSPQSGAGRIPLEASMQSCTALCAGTLGDSRQMLQSVSAELKKMLCFTYSLSDWHSSVATCSSSSSSSNESDLGGAITLLLQDHRTTKSVCKQPEHSKQFML